MFSIFKKELVSYFNSYIGYLTIGLFLLVTGLFVWIFPDTSIITYGYATLESFFFVAPYVLMFLVPAITMKSIAGEKNDGTFELLITKPVSIANMLLAKFFGSYCVVLLAILPTLIYYIAVYQLGAPKGNIDSGAVFGSYFGLFFLGAIYVSIGIFASCVTPNAIAAFLLAIFLCFCLFIGIEAVSALLPFDNWQEYVAELGINAHYESISRGVLDSRDLIYFIGITFLMLYLANKLLIHSRKPLAVFVRSCAVIFFVFFFNWILQGVFFRVDLTAEDRFTLAPTTKKILRSLPGEVRIVVFLDGDLPAGFRRLRRSTSDLLAEMKAFGGHNIKFTFLNPLEGTRSDQQEAVETLMERGIVPTNLSVQTEDGLTQKAIYPVAVVLYEDQEIPVKLLTQNRFSSPEIALNNSIQNLEYAFANAIQKVTSDGRPIIAFTESNGELRDLEIHDAMNSLMDSYQVGRLQLDAIDFESLEQISTIVIAQPRKAFSELQKFKLDYFVRQGGKILWAINQSDGNLDSLRDKKNQLITAQRLNLDDILFRYGVRLNYDILADLNSAQIPLNVGSIGNTAQLELVPWVFYPILIPRSSHPIVKDLDGIRTEFPGSIDTVSAVGIRKEILLRTTDFSKVLRLPNSISLDDAVQLPGPEEFKGEPLAVAVLLQGTFNSLFQNRPLPEGVPHNLSAFADGKETKMVVISDGNVFKNSVDPRDKQPLPMGWDRYTEQQYGNKTFFLNAIDFLAGDSDMLSLRGKEVKMRLLDRVKVKRQQLFWQVVCVGAPPVLLFLIGFGHYYLRKMRFGRKLVNR